MVALSSYQDRRCTEQNEASAMRTHRSSSQGQTRLSVRGVVAFACAGSAALALGLSLTQAAPPDPDAIKFFETSVRPILAENCVKCHGESKQKGGLRLDSPTSILQGGESGPAVIRGKTAESLLIEA